MEFIFSQGIASNIVEYVNYFGLNTIIRSKIQFVHVHILMFVLPTHSVLSILINGFYLLLLVLLLFFQLQNNDCVFTELVCSGPCAGLL